MHTGLKLLFSGIVILIFLSSYVLAVPSNKSVAAENNLTLAVECVQAMLAHNISISRANDSLSQAQQLYAAQFSLEQRGGKADYSLVTSYVTTTCQIRDSAIKATDELAVFLQEYQRAASQINLSAMDDTYSSILTAYREERFEDTISLIDQGYVVLSQTESTQTQLNLFYLATTQSITSFFTKNWKLLTVIAIVLIIVIAVFWRVLKRKIVERKISALRTRRNSIFSLIKKTQTEYFKSKKMPEMEFDVKMETFKEMIRDIDRQIPIFNEQLAKVTRTKKVYK